MGRPWQGRARARAGPPLAVRRARVVGWGVTFHHAAAADRARGPSRKERAAHRLRQPKWSEFGSKDRGYACSAGPPADQTSQALEAAIVTAELRLGESSRTSSVRNVGRTRRRPYFLWSSGPVPARGLWRGADLAARGRSGRRRSCRDTKGPPLARRPKVVIEEKTEDAPGPASWGYRSGPAPERAACGAALWAKRRPPLVRRPGAEAVWRARLQGGPAGAGDGGRGPSVVGRSRRGDVDGPGGTVNLMEPVEASRRDGPGPYPRRGARPVRGASPARPSRPPILRVLPGRRATRAGTARGGTSCRASYVFLPTVAPPRRDYGGHLRSACDSLRGGGQPATGPA